MNSQNRVTHCFMAILVNTMLWSSPIGGFAQSPNQSPPNNNAQNNSEIIACSYSVTLTLVRVKVSDRTGKEISDLTKDDFVVYEDGVRQQLVFWTREDGDSDLEGIQSGYEIAYYPIKYPFDGKFRRIRVVVIQAKGKNKLRVEFSPKGYYAKKELLR